MHSVLTKDNVPDFEAGATIVIDKPVGWSSFDVVNKIRWKLKHITGNKKIKVGHAGTLDPLATGVLVICTGKATKTIESIQVGEKEYEATFRLGATTPSFDLETKINKTFHFHNISDNRIINELKSMEGISSQTPPIYSAVQINGRRAYDFARKGETVKLKSREINIKGIALDYISLPYVKCTISCSKGTYIRSLADDFGKRLDNGAFLYYLRRIRSGDYSIEKAFQLNDFINFLDKL